MSENRGLSAEMIGPDQLRSGVVFDGSGSCDLSQSPVTEITTSLADHIAVCTHAGFGYKSVNEDRIALVEQRDEEGLQNGCFVIDGMGGHRDGHIAAQILAEQFIQASGISGRALHVQCRELLLDKILEIIYRLPSKNLINRVVERANEEVFDAQLDPSLEEIFSSIVDIVQIESIQVTDTRPENLELIAEVVNSLFAISLPERTEIAIHATKERIEKLEYAEKPPDACFMGAIIHTDPDGRRSVDIRQIGDCKLFVCDRDGRIKFQSINEAVIPEPRLTSRHLRLAELMTYSLHRNFVSNSMNRVPLNTKRYRKSDVPIVVEPGDNIQIYSDGCDDIFTPDELVAMSRDRAPADYLRMLLANAEKRMRYVNALLKDEQNKRSPSERMKAYPALHRLINERRIRNGCYFEEYPDGSSGRWVKPPKCDNFAMCSIKIGDPI